MTAGHKIVAGSSRTAPRVLLAGGIVAGPLFLAAGLAQGLARDGFDFSRNALSQLSLGGLGWIQVTAFVVVGALVIADAIGLRQVLWGSPGGTWAPRLIGVFGASFLAAAVFTADPGAGFPAGAALGLLWLTVSTVLTVRTTFTVRTTADRQETAS